jgi:thymidylate kinase
LGFLRQVRVAFREAQGTEPFLNFSTGFRGKAELKPVLISFSGIDGAGKSTQIKKLREYLDSAGIPVRELTFWDHVVMFSGLRAGFSKRVLQSDGAIGSPEKPADRHDKNNQLLPLLIGRSVLHIFDVLNLARIVRRAKAENTGVVIFDRYIYDQLAALPMGSGIARTYARLLLKLVPKPDLCYLLDAVPEVARARKPEYPLDFMRKYRSSYLELRKVTELELISAGTPEEVHQAVVERFKKYSWNTSSEAQITSAVVA